MFLVEWKETRSLYMRPQNRGTHSYPGVPNIGLWIHGKRQILPFIRVKYIHGGIGQQTLSICCEIFK